jgi:acyl-CoA dehydrogenase
MRNAVGAAVMSAPSTSLLSGVIQAAASAAAEVDRQARFPIEAIDAAKAAKLLSCSLPRSCGGGSYPVSVLAQIARDLGSACSSAAMVFAMHHAQALTLARHGSGGPTDDILKRITANELLIASATTEVTTGGDIGSSTCAVITENGEIVVRKEAPVISYAEHADYICATARRTPDSPPNDQVLLLCPAETTTLTRVGTWDALGFRGTCSLGYELSTRASREHLLPGDYAAMAAATMVPASHTLWAAVWLGMADAALAKARRAVRQAAARAAGQVTPQARRLADLTVVHQEFESSVLRAVERFEAFVRSGSTEPTMGFMIAMNNLKLTASAAVADVVTEALHLIGLNGYREDHPLSVGRLLRDSFAPALMVSNDRIRENNARLVLAHRG